MFAKDSVELNVPPEVIFDWLMHFVENYRSWHPGHVTCRWVKGAPFEVGSVLYAEEYLGGYRTLTSKPGHHMTMIQTLSQSIGLDKQIVVVLDVLRKQRNVAEYSGDIVPTGAVDECIKVAEILLHDVNHWLKANKPELIKLFFRLILKHQKASHK